MHITHPLKRNIFTGLWHRTLPTLHSMSAQTNSPPSSSQRNSSQLTLATSSRFLWEQKVKHNAGRVRHDD